MFNQKAHRVVFACGVLFVLSLAAFGSMIAVAWMSMNNTMDVTSDSYFNEGNTAQTAFVIAWRLDPGEVRIINHRDTVARVDYRETVARIDFRLDPGTVRSPDYKDAVAMIDFRLDPGTVRSPDYKDAVAHIDFRLDPGTVRSLDYKDAVAHIDFKNVAYAIH